MAIQPIQDEPTIGRLVTDASRDISSLIHKEIELAKSELKVSVKDGGTGVGLFAGAAFLVLLALIMLSVALAYLIHWNGEGLDLQWAFLHRLRGLPADRRAAGLHRLPQGQEGPRPREGDRTQAQETAAALKRPRRLTGPPGALSPRSPACRRPPVLAMPASRRSRAPARR